MTETKTPPHQEPTLEELADEMLRREARGTVGSLRKLGIIDERRARTIREREIPFSSYQNRGRRYE